MSEKKREHKSIEDFINSGEAENLSVNDEKILKLISQYDNDLPLIFFRAKDLLNMDDSKIINCTGIIQGKEDQIIKMMVDVFQKDKRVEKLFYIAMHICMLKHSEEEKKDLQNSLLEFAAKDFIKYMASKLNKNDNDCKNT